MIILASSSPRRTELLAAAGIEHRIISEDTSEVSSGAPAAVVRENARRKAGAVAASIAIGKYDDENNCLKGLPVLGADTIVALEQERGSGHSRIFGKPKDEAEARAMLMELSGRVHSVYTGICFIQGDREYSAVEKTLVHFMKISQEALDRYITSGEWQGKAGAYAVQGRAMAFVDRLDGSAANVIGLPVHAVVVLAEENGIKLYGN